jgi:hypothetical protein
MKSNTLRAATIRGFALLALSLPAAAPAQEAEVSMRIDLVAWGDEIAGLTLGKPGETNTQTALPFRYSEPVSYSGPILMEIYKSGDGGASATKPAPTAEDLEHESIPIPMPERPAADPNAAPKSAIAIELEKRRAEQPDLVSLAKLPANCRRATVLLAPAANNTYQAYVIDDDPTKLPTGQLRIHNLSPHTIALRLNDAPAKELKTRATLLVPAPSGQVIFELAYQIDGEWKFQESNIISVRANEQTQMIVLRSENQFFLSSDGGSGGHLQLVTLRRTAP